MEISWKYENRMLSKASSEGLQFSYVVIIVPTTELFYLEYTTLSESSRCTKWNRWDLCKILSCFRQFRSWKTGIPCHHIWRFGISAFAEYIFCRGLDIWVSKIMNCDNCNINSFTTAFKQIVCGWIIDSVFYENRIIFWKHFDQFRKLNNSLPINLYFSNIRMVFFVLRNPPSPL